MKRLVRLSLPVLLGGVLWSLSGCMPPSTLFVNDEGNVSRCASYGTGGYGMETAASLHTSCVNDLKQLGYVSVPPVRMGVHYALATSRVEKVEADSGAARAGIRVGDTLVTIDGKPPGTATERMRSLATKQAGDMVLVVIERNGARRS